jgi:dTDP-4-amino-4,6-dideoxygalactose transaminase
MSGSPIPFGKPMIDVAEIEAMTRVMSGTQLVHGPVTKAFEEAFAARIGASRAVSVSSCTAGLHLSLFAQGIGPGDEVVVPAMTHVATAHAVEFCGARPVFADVEPDTGNLDAAALEKVIGPKTRAIMPVHYLGLPCDMDRINTVAQRTGAVVVEDCALAVDATYDGRKAGVLGTTGCFSFYPVKHMTTLEGGMVTTNNEALADAIAKRKAFGYDRTLGERKVPGLYDVDALGYNYRMNEGQAAVGLAQLAKLDGFQAARARNYAALKGALADVEEVTVFEARKAKAVSSHYCLNAVLPRDGRLDRNAMIAELNADGIGTSIHYPRPVPLMRYYSERYGYRAGEYPVAEWLAAQTISLPVGPHLAEGDPARIAQAVKSIVRRARAA